MFCSFSALSSSKSDVVSMPDESILQNLSATVSPIAASYGVDQLYLFGSRAREEERPDSDYDFLISKEKGKTLFLHAALWQALEDALQVPGVFLKKNEGSMNEDYGRTVILPDMVLTLAAE